MVMQLKKKPVAVEGVQYTGDNLDELKDFVGDSLLLGEAGTPVIKTLEGEMCVSDGDIVVKGVGGEFYPDKPEIFAETYECDGIATEKHWNKAERENAPASDWAVPAKKKLRIDDIKHVKLAWDMVTRTKGLSDEERASARRRILAKAHKLGVDTSGWSHGSISKEDIDSTAVILDQEEAMACLPPPVNVLSHLFFHAMEEACEIAWAFSKAQRYGLDTICPDTGLPNRVKVIKEMAEFRACVTLINEELEGLGQPTIAVDDVIFQQAFDERIATLQKEYQLGRFTLFVADDASEAEPAAAPTE
jgi:hypothetical protein